MDQSEAEKTTGDTYAEKKAKEQSEKAESASSISVLIPSKLELIDASKVNYFEVSRNCLHL